jgi:hypothetical protein
MSIIARNSLSASGSSGVASFALAFALYADLVMRCGGGFGAFSSSSSSSEMTTPLLMRAVVALLDSVHLDVDDGFARVLAGSSSSSESESFNTDFSFDLEGLASALDDATGGGSTGSALILRVSGGAGLGAAGAADFALPKKSSFPEGFGFAGSGLISGLTSFGSDLTTGCAFSVLEGAFDRPGSLFLDVEAVAEDFAFAEDRVR